MGGLAPILGAGPRAARRARPRAFSHAVPGAAVPRAAWVLALSVPVRYHVEAGFGYLVVKCRADAPPEPGDPVAAAAGAAVECFYGLAAGSIGPVCVLRAGWLGGVLDAPTS